MSPSDSHCDVGMRVSSGRCGTRCVVAAGGHSGHAELTSRNILSICQISWACLFPSNGHQDDLLCPFVELNDSGHGRLMPLICAYGKPPGWVSEEKGKLDSVANNSKNRGNDTAFVW
jgi:hypothetical protein